VDSSRAFRSRDQLLELVHWVRDTPTAREQHWAEWKSRIELGEKRWQARIAKFILGVSNRPRRIWEQGADGCAYILLGVEVGQLHNTALPDPAVFDKGVNLYLGASGPKWTAVAFNADPGIQVVVIVVEPPEPGRRPYIAKATFSPEASPVVNGRTYIRRASETTEASSEEVEEMLRERDAHVRGAGPAWALRLEVVKKQRPDRRRCLGSDGAAVARPGASGARRIDAPRSNPLNAFLNSTDGRTREQFHQQVDAFLNAAGQRVEMEILW
jgi:hypothetical protein